MQTTPQSISLHIIHTEHPEQSGFLMMVMEKRPNSDFNKKIHSDTEFTCKLCDAVQLSFNLNVNLKQVCPQSGDSIVREGSDDKNL